MTDQKIHGWTMKQAETILNISPADKEHFVLRSLFAKNEIENTNLNMDCQEMARELRNYRKEGAMTNFTFDPKAYATAKGNFLSACKGETGHENHLVKVFGDLTGHWGYKVSDDIHRLVDWAAFEIVHLHRQGVEDHGLARVLEAMIGPKGFDALLGDDTLSTAVADFFLEPAPEVDQALAQLKSATDKSWERLEREGCATCPEEEPRPCDRCCCMQWHNWRVEEAEEDIKSALPPELWNSFEKQAAPRWAE